MCVLEQACWCRCRVLLKVLLLECCVPFGAGLLVPLQGAASGCCQSGVCVDVCVWVGVCVCARFEAGAASGALLLEWRVRFGGGLLVPLQGAASGCCCCSVCAV